MILSQGTPETKGGSRFTISSAIAHPRSILSWKMIVFGIGCVSSALRRRSYKSSKLFPSVDFKMRLMLARRVLRLYRRVVNWSPTAVWMYPATFGMRGADNTAHGVVDNIIRNEPINSNFFRKPTHSHIR